jgi:hypothetical protein
MSISETVHADHLGRLAVVYIRQSSPHQALAHQGTAPGPPAGTRVAST